MPRYRKCLKPGCPNKIKQQSGSGGYCDDCKQDSVKKCRVAGCSEKIDPDRSKCRDCREEREPGYDRAKRPADWPKIRERQLTRQPQCELCDGEATEVDHIVPLAKGGTNKLSNLQSLCKPCHSRKTAREVGFFDGADEVDSEPRKDDSLYPHQRDDT